MKFLVTLGSWKSVKLSVKKHFLLSGTHLTSVTIHAFVLPFVRREVEGVLVILVYKLLLK